MISYIWNISVCVKGTFLSLFFQRHFKNWALIYKENQKMEEKVKKNDLKTKNIEKKRN